jgi:CubicO group peptidase (beta-lactamase class C family)
MAMQIVLCSRALTQTIPISGEAVPALKPLDDFIVYYMTKYGLVGGALAVAKNGRLLYARGYGNVSPGGPAVQPDTLFRNASISKYMTSRTLDVLMQDRGLTRDDPILPYINHLAPNILTDPREASITFRHCIEHTTGFVDTGRDPFLPSAEYFGTRFPTAPFIRDMFVLSTYPLSSDPGTTAVYTGIGPSFEARAIERITGHYEAYVRSHFLVPKGLTRARIASTRQQDLSPWESDYFPYPRDLLVPSNYPVDGGMVSAPYFQDRENVDAPGGWLTSAIDLAFLDVGPGPNRAELPPPFGPPYSIASAGAGGTSGTVAWEIVTWDDYTFGLAFNTNENRTPDPQDDLRLGIVNAADTITQWPTSDLFPAFLASWNQPTRFSVDTTPLQFTYTIGGQVPPPQVLHVVSTGAPESFKVTSPNHTWLQISPRDSASPADISISVDPSSGPPYVTGPNYGPLIPGTYNSSIYVESKERTHSPFFIPITLVVQSATPSTPHIDVSTDHQLPPGTLSTPYSFTLSPVGGTSPYVWSTAGGVVPAGLSVSKSGQISGTPSQAGIYSFLATVVDSTGWTTTRRFDLRVFDPALVAPIVNQGGVVSAAAQTSPVSPGSLVSIYGTNLSTVNPQCHLSAASIRTFRCAGHVRRDASPITLRFADADQCPNALDGADLYG